MFQNLISFFFACTVNYNLIFLFIDLEANTFNWHRNYFAMTEYLGIIANMTALYRKLLHIHALYEFVSKACTAANLLIINWNSYVV